MHHETKGKGKNVQVNGESGHPNTLDLAQHPHSGPQPGQDLTNIGADDTSQDQQQNQQLPSRIIARNILQ